MLQNIEVEIPGRLNPNDIIIFKNGRWTVQNKDDFLADIYTYVDSKAAELKQYIVNVKQSTDSQKAELSQDKQDLATFKSNVNIKLKEHHDVLNALTGGDK